MFEYELQADCEFVFKKFGSYGAAYFALIATGQNTYYSHYHKDTAKLQDGDLVQLDYAPDYKNYTSDVTRVFPPMANLLRDSGSSMASISSSTRH